MVYSSFYDNGGQEAILHYRRLTHNKYFSMLEVSLDTGRKNQIRVQLQAIGHPVAGDKKYGAHTNLIKRMALHAKTIKFVHPITKKEMLFDVHIPKSFYNLTNIPIA
jgi:23S rRNA pseudouridine1911/1915/1917 synthase